MFKILIQIFMGVFAFWGVASVLWGQQLQNSHFHSEASVVFKNGVRESRLFNVKFNQNVLPLPGGVRKGALEYIVPAFTDVVGFFTALETHYGKIAFYKKIPHAVWGDVWRTNKKNGELVQIHDMSQLFVVLFPQPVPVDSIIVELEKLPDVEYAYGPVQTMSFVQPNDPCYNNYTNCESGAPVSDQWNLKRIQAEKAWDISQGSSSKVIGIVDSGPFNRNHPDLDSKFTSDGDLDSTPLGLQHGTQVAGVVAAETNNSQGIASLGWNLKISSYAYTDLIFDETQGPNSVEYEIDRAVNDGVDIMNCSFGTFEYVEPNCKKSKSYEGVAQAIANAILQGVIVVAATGNTNDNPPGPCDEWFPHAPYPAGYADVIGVTVTDLNDNHPSGYNYEGLDSPEFLEVAAPGWEVPTTSSSLYGSPNGTSFATPHVAALAGLMLSINSTLDKVTIRDILINTAEKVGQYNYANGRNKYLGHGRINAYQALLLTHAYLNKSMSAAATASNSGRKIAKTSDGKWHIVYESGITSGRAGLHEIFYRNSSDGQNWSTPQRLSSGNEQNRYPCIAANGTKLYVVWQRKNDSTHDVHFSSSQNSGASWSSYVLGQTNLTLDPLPVIQTGVASNFSVMAIYRSNSGGSTRLVARRTTSTNPALGNWSTETTVPGTGANDFSPALASAQNYWGSDANFGVAYATTSGQIHYRYYLHATGGWSTTQFNLSSIMPGSNLTHKEPSLTGVGTGSTNFHVAWHRVTGSGSSPYDHAIIHRRSTGFDSWPNEYFVTYYEQQQLPALTALTSNKVDLVFSLTGSNQIYKQRFNGTSWASPTFVAAGQYPSIATGNTTAKYVWTSGSAAPYTVQLSSEILSKESSEDLSAYTRSVAWLNDEGGYIELQMKPAMLKLRDGSEQPLAFARATLDSFKLAPDNSWDLLQTAPKLFSIEAESLMVEYTIAASKWESVAEQSETPQFKVQLLDSANAELITSVAAPLDFLTNDFKTAHHMAIALDQSTDLRTMIAQMSIEYLHPKAASIASLGHIYDFTQAKSEKSQPPPASAKEREDGFALSLRVHPNPFNPATQIHFDLPSAGLVSLRIFDVNGRLVREWREDQRAAGEHVILWDGRDQAGQEAASGIYVSQIIFGGEQQMAKMTLVR